MHKDVIDITLTDEQLFLQSKQDALDVKRGFLKWLIHLFLLTSVFWFSVVINLILYFFDINVAQYSKIIDENLYFKNFMLIFYLFFIYINYMYFIYVPFVRGLNLDNNVRIVNGAVISFVYSYIKKFFLPKYKLSTLENYIFQYKKDLIDAIKHNEHVVMTESRNYCSCVKCEKCGKLIIND